MVRKRLLDLVPYEPQEIETVAFIEPDPSAVTQFRGILRGDGMEPEFIPQGDTEVARILVRLFVDAEFLNVEEFEHPSPESLLVTVSTHHEMLDSGLARASGAVLVANHRRLLVEQVALSRSRNEARNEYGEVAAIMFGNDGDLSARFRFAGSANYGSLSYDPHSFIGTVRANLEWFIT